jgi:DNA-binding CsgD family transcriptional regulator
MEAFADRAQRELAAAGERVHERIVEAPITLSTQEALVAWLARDGRTNPEIGAQLFLSARTVEWHMSKVFTKLGITSRRELGRALSETGICAADAPQGADPQHHVTKGAAERRSDQTEPNRLNLTTRKYGTELEMRP